jgi:hypothetical protein
MKKSPLKIFKEMLSTSKAIRRLCLLALIFVSIINPSHLKAKKETDHFANLKATFIINTLNYIRWQEKDLPSTNQPVEFLIVGDDKNNIATRLEYLLDVTELKINNSQLRIRRVSSLKEANHQIRKDGAKVVLLLDSELNEWNREKYPLIPGTLIMGESSKFLRKGLALTFRKENNRLKLGINLKRTKTMNLEISSRLLALNRVVIDELVH